jgi:hypothetical protein
MGEQQLLTSAHTQLFRASMECQFDQAAEIRERAIQRVSA